jgi:hypothetical protein
VIAGLFGVVSSQIDVPFSTTTLLSAKIYFDNATDVVANNMAFGDGVFVATTGTSGNFTQVYKKYPHQSITANWTSATLTSSLRTRISYSGGQWMLVGGATGGVRRAEHIDQANQTVGTSTATPYLRIGYHPSTSPGWIFAAGSANAGSTRWIPNDGVYASSDYDTGDIQASGIASSGTTAVMVGQDTRTTALYPMILNTTNPSGNNWTSRTTSFGTTLNTNIRDVFYANGYFVAVGSSGKIATSTNGTTWTQKVTGISVSDTVYSVTYHREKWYIINVNGSVYRSNTSDPTGTWSNMGDITTDTLTTNVELRSNEAYMFYADSAGDNVVLIR